MGKRAANQAPADQQLCKWFLLCDHEATGTMAHPILGDVPICARCRNKIEGMGR